MKKTVVKILIWMLNKLGYHEGFSQKHTITINLDSEEAERKLKRLTDQAETLSSQLIKINNKLIIKGRDLML